MIKEEFKKRSLEFLNTQRREKELFVVQPTIGSVPKVKPYRERLDNWLKMCHETNLPLQDYAIEGNGVAVLRFKNGLQLADNGRRVAFSAMEDKNQVNMNSALTVIRCSANHLCRQGWDLGVDFATVRYGSAQMVADFEKAHKEARQMLSAERVALLKKSARTAI